MPKRTLALCAALAAAPVALAQNPAPRETVSVAVGGKRVSIEYGRPSLKGRTFDDLLKLLPADRMWRAGVDQVTTLTTEGPLTIAGKRVPAGKYSLYVHAPETGEYSLAVNADLGVALGKIWAQAPAHLASEPWPHMDDYTRSIGGQEAARAPMAKVAPGAPVEMFTVTLTSKGAGAVLKMAWGDRAWTMDIAPAK
jgi:hypothetical protein